MDTTISPAGNVDEHSPRFHRGEAVSVEQTGRLGRPLAADHTGSLSGSNRSRSPGRPISLKPGGSGAPGCGLNGK
jgi:hypothetical protein